MKSMTSASCRQESTRPAFIARSSVLDEPSRSRSDDSCPVTTPCARTALIDEGGRGLPPPTREGWLDVLTRMLASTRTRHRSILARARHVAQCAFYLDEGFGSGFALAVNSVGTGADAPAPDIARLRSLVFEHDRLLMEYLLPALRRAGRVDPRGLTELTDAQRTQLRATFRSIVYPMITPSVVDATHPFPRIATLSPSLAVLVRDRHTEVERLVCVQVPSVVPETLAVDESRVFRTITVVSASLSDVFPGMEVLEASEFRVTRRRAETRAEDRPVRLEVEAAMSGRMLDSLAGHLALPTEQIYRLQAPLGISATVRASTQLTRHPAAHARWFGAVPVAGPSSLTGQNQHEACRDQRAG